jgi:hypothetical protein
LRAFKASVAALQKAAADSTARHSAAEAGLTQKAEQLEQTVSELQLRIKAQKNENQAVLERIA